MPSFPLCICVEHLQKCGAAASMLSLLLASLFIILPNGQAQTPGSTSPTAGTTSNTANDPSTPVTVEGELLEGSANVDEDEDPFLLLDIGLKPFVTLQICFPSFLPLSFVEHWLFLGLIRDANIPVPIRILVRADILVARVLVEDGKRQQFNVDILPKIQASRWRSATKEKDVAAILGAIIRGLPRSVKRVLCVHVFVHVKIGVLKKLPENTKALEGIGMAFTPTR